MRKNLFLASVVFSLFIGNIFTNEIQMTKIVESTIKR